MSNFRVGDRVKWIQRRRVYKGYEFTMREGTIDSIHGTFAVIKPPEKRSRRVSIFLEDLEFANATSLTETLAP